MENLHHGVAFVFYFGPGYGLMNQCGNSAPENHQHRVGFVFCFDPGYGLLNQCWNSWSWLLRRTQRRTVSVNVK